jgi:hypothetical protein
LQDTFVIFVYLGSFLPIVGSFFRRLFFIFCILCIILFFTWFVLNLFYFLFSLFFMNLFN